jgi:hypothetical protein
MLQNKNSPGNAPQKITDQGDSVIIFWILAAFVISAAFIYVCVKYEITLTGDSFVLSHNLIGEDKQS